MSSTDLENNPMVSRGEGWREGIVREFALGMHTVLHLKWTTSKDLLYSTGNSAQCCVAAWMGGEFGGVWTHTHTHTHIYMDESFCCSPETITTLLTVLYLL